MTDDQRREQWIPWVKLVAQSSRMICSLSSKARGQGTADLSPSELGLLNSWDKEGKERSLSNGRRISLTGLQ